MKINFEQELNSEQLRAVRETSGPALVLAGAGSGKTRTIVYRVAYLLEQAVAPSEILLLTFTNKAAREMTGRVEYLVGKGASDIWGGTFHHVAARILRRYGNLLGYKPNFSILDQDDSKNLIKLAVGESGIDPKARRFPSPQVLGDIFSFSRNAKEPINTILNRKYPNWVKLEQEIQNVSRTYSDKKRKTNSMDFDDLLLNFVLLLRDSISSGDQLSLREALQAKWKHILVDEYQDTNSLQGELIKLLYPVHSHALSNSSHSPLKFPPKADPRERRAGASAERGGDAYSSPYVRVGEVGLTRSLMVVGDDAQSIYSFRGATVENILEFPRVFPGTIIFRLETNYRSIEPILNLANEVIAGNKHQFSKHLRGVQIAGDKPNLVVAPTISDEASFIAEKILEFRDAGTPLNRIAVLFRATYQSEALEFELAKRDIPYEYRGGVRFFERAHIKDVIAVLRILANPRDELAWLRVLAFFPGIGAVSAAKIFGKLKELENLDEVAGQNFSELGNRLESGWQEFAGFFKNFASRRSSLPRDIIDALLNSSYVDYLEAEYPDWRERLEDLEQLKIFASSYENIADFVGELALVEHFGARRNSQASPEKEQLVLSTIHQDKGLEWEAVFIINMVNSAFPNRRALLEEGGVEEERRLFYVAITRAKKWLFVSYPLVGGIDNVYLNQPSAFLQEIDEDLFNVVRIQKLNNDLDNDNDNDLPMIDIGRRGYLPKIDELPF